MAKKTPGAVVETSDDILERARKFYERAQQWWSSNHSIGTEDVRFARLGEQWHKQDEERRRLECRPCETFNKMPSFIRQVVNDARQNKPAIKVHPADDKADPPTAELLNGLIRNIEVISNADAAYDTGIEHGADRGFGFWRVNTRYACDDSFEQDIIIERIVNSFSVFGDYRSEAVDSSDWNECIIATTLPKDEYEREYPNAEKVNWDFDFKTTPDWFDGENVTVGEYWLREKVESEIVALSDGTVRKVEEVERLSRELTTEGISVVGEPRTVESYKVTQYILSGAEVLKTVPWAGRYIPIVPVYGEEIIDETGKRHFRSLIHGAKGAARMYNYMRNTGIEMVGLAPKVPFIGKKGAFDGDENWQNVNSASIPYLEYEGTERPTRDGYVGVPQGVIQETLSANDDMKAIIGLHDASLGVRSNETSGKAIRARQMEGDTATFHFGDNQNRAIRHTGLILINLIPKVYNTQRMIRVLGEDMKPRTVPLMQPVEEPDTQGNVATRVYDLTVGKYDLTVSSGPAYTSRREEANEVMTAVVQAYPDSAPILAPRIMKNLEIPDADEISQEFDALNPAKQKQQQGLPPEVEQQMQEGMQLIQQLQAENAQLKGEQGVNGQQMRIKEVELEIKRVELQTKQVQANADVEKARIALAQVQIPQPSPSPVRAAA